MDLYMMLIILNMVYPMEKEQTYPWTQKVPSSNLPGIQKK